ncbi:MAG: tetratricopeptide repeat protein [Flavobacteriaceae bacterium]
MKKALLFLGLMMMVAACSTKKNGALNRAYHSTTSKFNPLFNGQEALRYGTLDITQKHQDNYWLRLSVDPYQLPDAFSEEDTSNEFFDRAQEKATLTVQKHSMLIGGEQRNKQISKAYLLLGKARYFNGSYLQAIEAFTYLIKNMGNSNEAIEAELWRAKSYLEMGQEARAARELTNIVQSGHLTTKQYALAQSALADALLREEKDTLATQPLMRALATEKSAAKRGRYAYLLGQLYEDLDYPDSAIVAYQQVLDLNRRVPRELWIHARLAQLKNNLPEDINTLRAYKKLLRSDEDRRFRDKIHYFYGAYLLKGKDTLKGEKELNASLKTNTQDRYLKSLIYEQLASNRIDQVAFVTAGAYLDSTLQNLEDSTRRYRKLKRQRGKLDDIITYEKTIASTDSLLRLMNMSPEKQKQVIDSYIVQLKEEAAKVEAEATSQDAGTALLMGSFYFYNSRQVENGKRDFQRDWANVGLVDNWKYASNATAVVTQSTPETTSEKEENPAYNPQTYLAQIPPPQAADSLKQLQHEAYFQAGLAYKEQFGVAQTAIERFTSLLSANPDERYLPPTLYHLYKLHANNRVKQQPYRNQILANYPQSDYAKMIQNPTGLAQTREENKMILTNAKELLAKQDYNAVIAKSEQQIPLLTDKGLQAEWAMLRAISLGRLEGLEAYKEALTVLVQTYPKTESASKAKEQLDGFEVYNNLTAKEDEKAKLVFVRTPEDRKQSEEDQKWIEQWIGKQGIAERLRVSIDVFDRNTETLVIHGFSSEASAGETRNLMKVSNPRLVKTKNIVVLTSNYRNALVSKRFEQLEN